MKNQDGLAEMLALVALVAIVMAFFSPIWWVSLTAPNYPKEAFPDGIRIHFHFDRVANGCKAAAAGTQMADELIQGDLSHEVERWNPVLDAKKNIDKEAKGLDCVHEMNTINHYVGMYPIETGAPVERPLAKFFFGFFAVMIVAFILPVRRMRPDLFIVACIGVITWVAVDSWQTGTDFFPFSTYFKEPYRIAVCSFFAAMIVAFALPFRQMRLIWLTVGCLAVAVWMIVDQFVLGKLDAQVQHYVLESGRFFKDSNRTIPWGENVLLISKIVIFGLIASMCIMVEGVAKLRDFQLLLIVVPALLPLFFVITYAGWLWFFGHNLDPWGAFTVKPFMPTVFGEGRVAQFSTYSYPTWGFGLLMLAFVCLGLALLMRRKQLREDPEKE